jgi:hypothetical protein
MAFTDQAQLFQRGGLRYHTGTQITQYNVQPKKNSAESSLGGENL